MRPYATVSPLFWTGSTGKRLRKNPDAQRVALYLMTSPHAHQSGLYYLPLMYLCHEVGMSKEGALKALTALSLDGFCTYDTRVEWVWVREMAAWQIGTGLAASDKRCRGVQYYLRSLPVLPFTAAFVARYANDFDLKGLPDSFKSLASPLEGTFYEKKGASSDQDQESEHDQNRTEQNNNNTVDGRCATVVVATPTSKKGTRIEIPFPLTDDMRVWVREKFPTAVLDLEAITEAFGDYWRAVPGAKGLKLDWVSTWRNRIRDLVGKAAPRSKSNGTTKPEREYDPDDHSMDGYEDIEV
jgi:hypothetical protein